MGSRKRHVVELHEEDGKGGRLVNRGGGIYRADCKAERVSIVGAGRCRSRTLYDFTRGGGGEEVTRVCINKPDLVPRVVGLRSPSQSMRPESR